MIEESQSEPEKLSARIALPSPVQPLRARKTGKLELKPFPIGKYLYWDRRATGFRLDYKKRDKSYPSGWKYLYLGFWSHADMLALMTELTPSDCISVIRREAQANALKYLKRRKQREQH